MRRPTAVAAVAAAAAAILAAPAGASAAEVLANQPCPRLVPGTQTFAVGVTGFPAGAPVTIRAGENVLASGSTDSAGAFAAPAFAPALSSPERFTQTFMLTAADDRGTTAGPKPLTVTRIGVGLPERARPRSVVRFRVHGFVPGRTVFLHVRRGGRTLGRFSLGRATGPCGNTTHRLPYMPLRRFSSGTYRYYFSHSRRFALKRAIYGIRVTISRRRVPRALAFGAPAAGF